MPKEKFIKKFTDWIKLKEKMDREAREPIIKEGEVWWCGIGANVGVEISGKGNRFSRPVVILKKLSKFGFMGVPLTTQEKTGSWYVPFEFLGVKEFAAICQSRVISVSRLYGKMGQLPTSDLNKIKDGFHKLYK